MRRLSLLAFLLGSLEAAAPAGAGAQPAMPPDQVRLRVYLDCLDCFESYLRDEIEWVDFVRQPQDADVHLLSSSQETGGGGREVVLRFVGIGRFAGTDQELRALSLPAETENVRRENIRRTVEVGLLNYLARQGIPPGITVGVEIDSRGPQGDRPAGDPWNLWFFEATTSGSVNAEETTREIQWELDFTADRVSEAWKISFGASLSREHETFDLDEEEDAVDVRRRETSVDGFIAKSLGPHWSVGLEGGIESSTFENRRFQATLAPAVEFSVFPYQEYATRQFVIEYQAGVERVEYNEVTLYDKLEETLGLHAVSISFDQRQPWGSIQTGVEWSQYLHDLSRYRLEVDGEVSLRLVRGLSFEVDGAVSRIRDQLSLPRRSATQEEVLLRLRELQSGYDISLSIGLSYSFGSIFNNIVNPRFDN